MTTKSLVLSDEQCQMLEQSLAQVDFVLKKMLWVVQIDAAWSYEDFEQIGRIGLIEAVQRYDASLGFTFSTLARKCIKAEILNQINMIRTEKRKGNIVAVRLDEPLDHEGDEKALGEIVGANDDMENTVLSRMACEYAWEIIKNLLSRTSRDLLQMAVDGASISDIVEATGMSKRVAYKRLTAIRRKISEAKEALTLIP